DAAERATRNSVREARPGVAAVDRFPDSAAWTTAVHATRRPATLIRRCVDRLRIRVRHREIVRARLLVDEEHALPRLAAIRRLVTPATAAWSEDRADRRDQHDVVVARIDQDAVDVLRVLEPDVGERLTAVGGLPHTVAPRRGLTVVGFACPDPNDI